MNTPDKITIEIEGYSFNIRKDNTQKREKFYCVVHNPFVKQYDSKVVYGCSLEAIKNKVVKQFEKFKKESRGK